MRLAAFLVSFGYVVFAVFAWRFLDPMQPAYRVGVLLFGCAFAFPMIKFVTVHGFVGFLARQVFATRTSVWVSPRVFAFRSRIFVNPVAIWRLWKGQLVRLSFILNQDDDAALVASELRQNQQALQSHLKEAMVLEVVVSARNTADPLTSSEQLLRRTVPVTEISVRNARRFSTVLAAAVAITAKLDLDPKPVGGTDIDG